MSQKRREYRPHQVEKVVIAPEEKKIKSGPPDDVFDEARDFLSHGTGYVRLEKVGGVVEAVFSRPR